jgi:hypothetical protein
MTETETGFTTFDDETETGFTTFDDPDFAPLSFDAFSGNGQAPHDVTDPEPKYTEPKPEVAQEKKRSRRALEYEAQINGLISSWFKASVTRPGTVADAAAISLYGPNFAKKGGDLAAHDKRIGAFLKALEGGVENPYLAAIAVGLPLALQLIRNHEPVLEPQMRRLRIPFSKSKKHPEGRRWTLKKFGLRLGMFRHQTDDPQRLYNYVFNESPAMRKAMEAQGITVARFPGK